MQHVFAKSGLDKRERDELKEGQQRIQAEFEATQKFQEGLAHFKKEAEGQSDIKFLTRDIVGQFIDWIAVYPADRSVQPYTQKIEIHYHSSGRLKKSYKPIIDCECSYSICPI